eukprot:COSAG04_NODE_3959_length_2396_cov_7.354375_5_plen_66_part_00
MKLSLAYPAAGTQKLIEIDDDAKLCVEHPIVPARRSARLGRLGFESGLDLPLVRGGAGQRGRGVG